MTTHYAVRVVKTTDIIARFSTEVAARNFADTMEKVKAFGDLEYEIVEVTEIILSRH